MNESEIVYNRLLNRKRKEIESLNIESSSNTKPVKTSIDPEPVHIHVEPEPVHVEPVHIHVEPEPVHIHVEPEPTKKHNNRYTKNYNKNETPLRDFGNKIKSGYNSFNVNDRFNTDTAKGVFSQLFDTWIAKIKTLSNPTINPGGNHPNNTAANPVNFNMNDWLLVGICVVGVALVFSDHSKEFDENGNLIQQTQQTQPLSIGNRLSHDPKIRNQIEKQNISTITFGERKILDHISSSASDNNKLVCELFLQTVKQTTGWWNDGTDRYDVKSQTAYKNACNRLLNTEYNY
jgi:hypothetical protein